MKELKLESGNVVIINPASFSEATALKSAVFQELSTMNINIKTDVALLISNSFLKLEASESVRKCLFTCFKRCTYNKEAITQDTFEDSERWGDYYPIAIEVMRVNLEPFMKGIISWLSEIIPSMKETYQKLKSKTK